MIDPNEITTVRVGQLASSPFSLSDYIPHEAGNVLKKGTVEELSTFIASIIGSSEAVGFYPITITDGGQLPNVPETSKFILVGKGTYLNVNGFSDIVCTKELNVIISVEEHWELSLEIPIEIDPLEIRISQTIRQNITDYAPSENAVFNALNQYLTSVGSFNYADLATQTTPLNVVATIPLEITNDALGSRTDLSKAPYGIGSVVNLTTRDLDFTDLSIGDLVNFTLNCNLTTTSANQTYSFYVIFGIGSGNEVTKYMTDSHKKTGGILQEAGFLNFVIENEDMRDYPAKVYLLSDGNGTLKVNEFFFSITRKNINVVKVQENYIHDFTSIEDQQEFVIPDNYTLGAVFLNRTFLVQSEYTFSGGILTILETLETGTIISTR